MVDLGGKVALVTGGAAGLGSAIAAALLAEGCKVALLDINEKQGTKTASEFQQKYGKESCVFFACDVTNENQLDERFKDTRSTFGGLDIVVNNAGIFREDNWRKVFAINIESVYSGILLGFEYMGKDKGYNGGHVINTASIAGGKVALVTGAAAGLGSAIAEALLAEGCKVALLDIDERRGIKTASEFQQKYGKGSCVFFACDVTNDGQLDECFKDTRSTFGGLDIVVNNAGIFREDNWRKVFAINIESVYSGILLGFKHMGKDKGYNGGHVINTASIAGLNVAPASPAYNTSKCAVVAMTRAFGSKLHLDRHGVKVSCLCPDPIDTELWTQVSEHLSSEERTAAYFDVQNQKVQRPADVARGVIKLLEDGQNGAALVSTSAQGLRYYNFQEPTPNM
ncbi:15-hydroxyprostaglandin dehydrogenase [Ixodes scapularis]